MEFYPSKGHTSRQSSKGMRFNSTATPRQYALVAALFCGVLATGCSDATQRPTRVVERDDIEQTRGAGPPSSPYAPEVAPPESAEDSDAEKQFTVVKVYYGTDRAVDPDIRKLRFGAAWTYVPWTFAAVALGVLLLAGRIFRGRVLVVLVRAMAAIVLLLAVPAAVFATYAWWQVNRHALPSKDIYGSERGTLERGFCEVSIPKQHKLGGLEGPSVLRLEFFEDPKRDIMLREVSPVAADEFFSDLGECVSGARSQSAFVFVHGYNVSFERAARRTAQMAYDLKFDGAPIFFSWPSQGKLQKYTVDEAAAAWAAPDLKEFLVEVAERCGVRHLHLIAHSMGNRVLTAALRDLSGSSEAELPMFDEVVLTAPDIDADVFRRDLAPKIVRTAKRVTLYASSHDEALALSKQVHGYPRAGDTGGLLVVLPGIDTIDVSNVDTSLIGHAYYGSNGTVLADLFGLLHEAKAPSERKWLQSTPFGELTYWIFLRERISDLKPVERRCRPGACPPFPRARSRRPKKGTGTADRLPFYCCGNSKLINSG